MSETPRKLESRSPVQPASQPEPERQLQAPPLFQPTVPDTDQQTQLHSALQLSENQQHAEPVLLNHRWLLALLAGLSLCVATLLLIYTLHILQPSTNQTDHAPPCLSPACQRASARLSRSADPFAQPCDFFMFTCGSDTFSSYNGEKQRSQHIHGHPQLENDARQQWSVRSNETEDSEDKIQDRKNALALYLREILEAEDKLGNATIQKARGFYHSCLDTKAIDRAGAEPFLTLVQKLGGWAMSGQWNQTDFNSTLRILMRDYATFPFFSLQVGGDPKELARGITKKYIQIDQPDLLIPIEWNNQTQKSHVCTQTARLFLASCENYLALLGSPPSSSMIHVGMFISLSSELAVAAAPRSYRLSKGLLYQRMTIKDLQRRAPAIDWLGSLQAAFHPLSLTEDDLVLLHNLPYLEKMSLIIDRWLHKHELRASNPVHTYMVFHLLHTVMPALDSRFSDTAKNLSMALGASEGVVPRWKHCVMETERGFDSVLRNLLSERIAGLETAEVIRNIFSSFKSKLHELTWIDQKYFQVVMKKVRSLTSRLWTTKDFSSDTELNLLFSEVGTQNFFSSYIHLLSAWQKRRNKLLTEQTKDVNIMSVTPFLLDNELIFPVGMFVPPLFHHTYPRAMHYGVTGFLIAKDILHLLLPDIYSQSATVRAVGECVWTRYLSMTGKEGRGGAFSLSAVQLQEVWVQYSALQIALQAYSQSLVNKPGDTSISGLSHTRLFLRAFSQVNCDSDTYSEFMPLEPSFLLTVLCGKSGLCPTNLQCQTKTQQPSLQKC